MPAGTVAGVKLCCKCGKDVTSVQRMKSSDGRYWCRDCGEKDEGRKGQSAGGICAGCHESFSKSELTSFGGRKYCPKCAGRQFHSSQSFFGKVWSRITGKG